MAPEGWRKLSNANVRLVERGRFAASNDRVWQDLRGRPYPIGRVTEWGTLDVKGDDVIVRLAISNLDERPHFQASLSRLNGEFTDIGSAPSARGLLKLVYVALGRVGQPSVSASSLLLLPMAVGKRATDAMVR